MFCFDCYKVLVGVSKEMTERERFEKALLNRHYGNLYYVRRVFGRSDVYLRVQTREKWWLWQTCAKQKEERRILSHNLFRGCEKANRLLRDRLKQKDKELSWMKEKIRILSDQGANVAWERDDLKEEIVEFKARIASLESILDEYDEKNENINIPEE